jgi:hypothetical protein
MAYSVEYCITEDGMVVEDGFYSVADATDSLGEGSGEVERRDLYDEDGDWIEVE